MSQAHPPSLFPLNLNRYSHQFLNLLGCLLHSEAVQPLYKLAPFFGKVDNERLLLLRCRRIRVFDLRLAVTVFLVLVLALPASPPKDAALATASEFENQPESVQCYLPHQIWGPTDCRQRVSLSKHNTFIIAEIPSFSR